MLIKAGTYRFNDVLTAPVGGVACQLRFLTNFMGYDGVLCTEMQVGEYPELGFYVVSAPEELLEIVHAYGGALPTNLWVYSDGWNSFYGNGVKTVTISEEQEVSDEFYAWFTANAVEQKEISGKWKFNDVLTYAGYNEVAVNFTAAVSSGDGAIIGQCDFLTYGYNLNIRLVSSEPDLSAMGVPLPLLLPVYNPEEDIPWLYDVNYIDFGTEPQTVSADFYNWLTANAVPVMASITHNGSTIAELFPGQTATLKCKGMKMEDDVVVEVAEQNMQTKNVTITENGTIEITPDDGFFGLSKIVLSVNVEGGTSGGNTVEIVSWAGGTDEQIAAMVAALDDGTLTIEETGWQIGDERTVTLSAMDATGVGESHEEQEVTLVLMDSQHYNLTKATVGGSTKDHFVVGMKNRLVNGGHITTSEKREGSWIVSARRTWCNEVFRAAIPKTLRPCFKQFKVPTATTFNASSVTETDDYFTFFAEKEIFGSCTFSNPAEASVLSQIRWYELAPNRIKTIGNGGQAGNWKERSPSPEGEAWFGLVRENGTADYGADTGSHGIAPFGCI